VFFRRLKGARRDLERANRLDLREVAGFGPLLRAARGLQLGEAHAWSCLKVARQRNPWDFQAHQAMLTFLCKKWFGTHKKMFAFARQTCAELPEDHLLFALLVTAHYERWLYAAQFDHDAVAAQDYWERPNVREEVLHAYERSLGSPRLRESKTAVEVRKTAVEVRKTFVAALVLTGETGLAKREHTMLRAPLPLADLGKWGQHSRTISDFCRAASTSPRPAPRQ
jgi:hypothetical protein